MSETRMMKCDECGKMIERTEWEIPVGWMHLSAWYRPEDSEGKYSGCADMDLCPKCVRKYRFMDDLADKCVEDYEKNVRRESIERRAADAVRRVLDMRAPSVGAVHPEAPQGVRVRAPAQRWMEHQDAVGRPQRGDLPGLQRYQGAYGR